MSDYYVSRYTAGRLRELRAEAARERLGRPLPDRRPPSRRLLARLLDRGRVEVPVAGPCCA